MAEGWFLFSEGWVWSTRQQAAQALIELREDRLSFRFFQLLAGLSPIQGPYGYLVVLLALALGVKVLELPLLARTAKFSVRMRPRLEALLRLRESDPEAAQQQLVELYQREGGGTMSGCALSLVDLIFVVWAFVTLSQFSPQLVLHGARFLWAPDVTRYDLGVVVVWVLVMLAHTLANQQAMRQMGQTAAQMIVGALVSGSILAALAHHWEWPAYIFVFWAILATLSLVIGKTFVAVSEATA
jgi:membrane protein insertase Oxa1/YidC/SpoIIIJ